MNAQLTTLRTLIMKELDPTYFNLDQQQVSFWLNEIPLIQERIFKEMQNEMMGNTENTLVERHVKQVQYDCMYLSSALCKYAQNNCLPAALYEAAGNCLDHILSHIDNHYAGFFNLQRSVSAKQIHVTEHPRIKVSFSVDALAYFFKLLNKAGGLDTGTFTQLILAISKNFITPGTGDGYISANSLTVKYKQVVQTTAARVRVLLVKMLKQLDQEF